jgi:hypothetical protein
MIFRTAFRQDNIQYCRRSAAMVVLSLATNLANNSAADNSNRGIDTVFKGATLFFEHSKLLFGLPVWEI